MLLILCEIIAKSTKIVDEHCSFVLRACGSLSLMWMSFDVCVRPGFLSSVCSISVRSSGGRNCDLVISDCHKFIR